MSLNELLLETMQDLRSHDDLVNQLEAADAIDEGWPASENEYPVVVRVQPVTETGTHVGSGTTRTYRLQVSVVATLSWREDHAAPMLAMTEIMEAVADRLDIASGLSGYRPDGVASGTWQEVERDRLALIQDWRTETTEIRR